MAHQQLEAIDPRAAFRAPVQSDADSTRSAVASQAAFLLSARAGVLGWHDTVSELREEAKGTDFTLPALEPLERDHRLTVAQAHRPLGVSASELAQEDTPDLRREQSAAVDAIYERPSTENAAALFEASLYSPHPLVRVAAAAGARETTRSRERILQILVEESASSDPDVASLAREALAQIQPAHPALARYVIKRPVYAKRNRKSNTAVLTHGTASKDADWYKPGGDFYTALVNDGTIGTVHDRSFTWTGLYNHKQRLLAASDLKTWIPNQGLTVPHFFAHSHGATVANLATQNGVKFDRLVWLAWPVHTAWAVDFSNVKRVIDVRVKLDLTIILDRGGQRFHTPSPKYEEHVNGWFLHSYPRDPEYWDTYDLWSTLA